jgi:hypothetical protein
MITFYIWIFFMRNFADALVDAASKWKGAAKFAATMIVLHYLSAASGLAWGAPLARANHQLRYQAPIQGSQPSGTKIVRRVEPLRFGSTLVVKNPVGSIEMRGWDRQQLHVQASALGESDSAPILEVNRTPNGAEVIVKDISRRRFLGLLPPKMTGCDLIINLPKRVLADVKTINGAIAVSLLDGSLKCETINGRIYIERVLGRIEAKSVSGAIAMSRLAPGTWPMRQNVEPGRDLQGRPPPTAFDGLIVKSVNGSIALEDVMGDAQVSTIHGKIEARRFRVRGGETSFETIAGDLQIEMLMGASEIIAKSMAGKIDIQLPNSKMVEETKTQAIVQLRVRPSQPQTITLKTVSGTIIVR